MAISGIALALKALPAVGQAVSAIQGNQNRQRAKGEINKAYRLGRERLDLRQGDIRRAQAERLGAQGLAQGGVRLRTAPVRPRGEVTAQPGYTNANGTTVRLNPAIDQGPGTVRQAPVSVTGARTLGEQRQLDLQREQQLEQDAMRQQRDNALAGVDAGYTQSLVNGAGQAVAGTLNAMQTPPGAFGIDVRDPLKTADWGKGVGGGTMGPDAPGTSVDKFNTFQSKWG